MEEFKWWRRLLGGVWYKHSSSRDGLELSMSIGTTWWARHYKINRFSERDRHQLFIEPVDTITEKK